MSAAPLLRGRTGEWELVIGLEVHAQVISQSKLFSGAATAFGAGQNEQVSLVDAAMPGMLPVINHHVVDQAIRTGLALGAEINLFSVFDRKNYFYPDLPQGYQISQFSQPIVGIGVVTIDLPDGGTRDVGITRLHLEQDAGKSLHDQHPSKTYVDLNRSGVALMEIVSEPDLRSADEASAYFAKLRAIVRAIGTCDGNMEEGSMRADANVSVRRPGGDLGTRAEIKNVNSLRFLRRAIDFEAARQIEVLEDGGEIVQETRLYDAERGETRSMRSKEESHDYRYFPDPDLLPLKLTAGRVARLKADLPELPDAKQARFETAYGLKPEDAAVLVAESDRADFFEKLAAGRDAKRANNWVVGTIIGALNRSGGEFADLRVTPDQIGALIDFEADGAVSGRIAKQDNHTNNHTPHHPPHNNNPQPHKQVSDSGAIEAEVDTVLAANPDQVAAYKGGKDKLMGFFVGQVMKATQGKANPQGVNEILRKKLSQ